MLKAYLHSKLMFSKPYILKADLYSKMEFSKPYIWFTEYMVYRTLLYCKRAFNLLWGVNQGCSHLLARGLEKGQPGVLVNTRRRLNALLVKT